MIADARAGKLDLIITKSVSRFARNVVDFLGMVRMLAEHNPRIGVFFEAECIYSLICNDLCQALNERKVKTKGTEAEDGRSN